MFDFFNSFDMNLMIWIHQNLSNTIFDKLMLFITNKNNWIVPIASLIIILCFFWKKGKFALFILIISLSLTDAICAQILKPFFERLRPSHLHLEQLNLLVSKGGNGACFQIMQQICFLWQLFYRIFIQNIEDSYFFLQLLSRSQSLCRSAFPR